ncbi:MAG: hypothetical protein E6626_13870 [Flavonifractor plautii]|nr:hypothetical protein [Flavonifractor plautii]MDU6291828.1 hypothetical protein [Flavonifractor plautii]MDU6344543.1 hypothetical protein [Flavonifractor plautii]
MAKRRANGEGNLRKQKDGRWEGRYTAGRDPETGRVIYKNVLGKTQPEAKAKLKVAIEASKSLDMTKAGQYTVGQWMEVWFEHYAKVKVRPSSHQTYRATSTTTSSPASARSPWKNSLLWNCRSSTRSCWSREGQAGWSPGTRPRG